MGGGGAAVRRGGVVGRGGRRAVRRAEALEEKIAQHRLRKHPRCVGERSRLTRILGAATEQAG